MISQAHRKLSNIADLHKKGIFPWVTTRFDKVKQFFLLISNVSGMASFPKKTLKLQNPGFYKSTYEKLLNQAEPFFGNSMLINDFNDIIATIDDNFDITLGGLPNEIHDLFIKLDKIFSRYRDPKKHTYSSEFKPIIDCLHHVYDYEIKFLRAKEPLWNAYQLSQELGIDVCPYCNRSYTNTVRTVKNPLDPTLGYKNFIRPEFDHFYLKSWCPYLALSFYNLIPSCSACNSSLKGQHFMSIETHSHPYMEGYEDLMGFGTEVDLEAWLKNTKVPVDIAFNPNNSGIPTDAEKRAKANAGLFAIKQVYNAHSDLAKEIFQKSTQDSKSYIETSYNIISEQGIRLFDNKENFYKNYVGNYMESKNFHLRPLSKFQYDLYRQTGIIKFLNDLETKSKI